MGTCQRRTPIEARAALLTGTPESWEALVARKVVKVAGTHRVVCELDGTIEDDDQVQRGRGVECRNGVYLFLVSMSTVISWKG